MGYSDDCKMVRVDFFRSSGKWYTAEAIRWTGEWIKYSSIHRAFAKSIKDHFKDTPNALSGFDAICLEPFHENQHPIQIKSGGWIDYD